MKKIIFLALLATNAIFAQQKTKPVTYKHGQNGIEFIVKNSDGMVVVSTFNAKVTIKDEIAEKVYALYQTKKVKPNQVVTIVGKNATVTGRFAVEKKDKLTSVDFIYERVEWNSGLVEVSE
jgi:hypothetical protein